LQQIIDTRTIITKVNAERVLSPWNNLGMKKEIAQKAPGKAAREPAAGAVGDM
jgi:hypothetical protein